MVTAAPVADPDVRVAPAGPLRTWQQSPLAVKSLLIGVFVNRLGAFVQVFLVLYLTDHGFAPGQAGAALGGYGVGSIAGALAGGWLADRIGTRRTIVASMIASAALLPVLLYVGDRGGDPVAVCAVAAGVGMASQAYRPASASLISQLTPADRQVMIFAMYRFAVNLGSTGAPLLGFALITASYDALFWGEATAALVFALVTALTVPGTVDANADAAAADDADLADRPAGDGSLSVITDGRFVLFLVAMFGFSVIYVQYLATLPLAVRGHGMSNGLYAALVAVNGLVVVTCELLVTKVVQGWRPRITVVLGLLLTAVGISLYAAPWGVAGFVVGTLIWSFGETVGAPTMSAYPARMAEPRRRGRYLGIAHGMFGLGAALGPVIGVAMWHRIGDGVWLWCGLIGVFAALAAAVSMRPPVTPQSA